jgi:Ca-activated chloride channel family protein
MALINEFFSTFFELHLAGNWADFHFLRPLWLLLGLIGLLLPLLFNIRSSGESDWEKAIPRHLLHYLSMNVNQQKLTISTRLLAALFLIASLALAGPSWNRSEQPVQEVQDDLVIVLDLSLSMYATDLKPNRITRTRQKILDILEKRKEGQTGLVVYSADAHVVTPLTDDTRTIKSMLPALEPFVMPAAGSEVAKGIAMAADLLKQAGSAKGRILLVTDGIEDFQIKEVSSALGNYPLNILSVGTQAGGPIDLPERGYLRDGNTVVIANNKTETLQSLAKAVKGNFVSMSLTDDDIDQLVLGSLDVKRQFTENKESDQKLSEWRDSGYLLTLPLILAVLVARRKGLLMLALVPLVGVIYPQPSHASVWDSLWKTDNQRAKEVLDSGNPQKAAELFTHPEWKANAEYKAENYEAAAKLYETQSNEDSQSTAERAEHYFNMGTSLAKAKDFEGALAALNQSIELNPNNEDAITNKEVVERILEKLKQQQQSDQSQSDQQKDQQNQDKDQNKDQSQQNQGDESNDQNNQEQQQQQQQQNNANQDQQNNQDSSQQSAEEKSSQSEQENKETSSEQQPQEQASEEEKQKQSTQQPNDSEQSPAEKSESGMPQELPEPLKDEEQQAFEQWMRRVPDDPSGLLRRKFAQQYQSRETQEPKEGRPLW